MVLQGGKLRLRTDHAYYYQVQLQMLVCKKTYCDVIVWTTKDFVTLRVYKDSSLCKSMVQRCQLYFECAVLPELCFSHWTNRGSCDTSKEEAQDYEPPTDVLYCVCRKPQSGKMIRNARAVNKAVQAELGQRKQEREELIEQLEQLKKNAVRRHDVSMRRSSSCKLNIHSFKMH
ncbi:hypothetical protein HPB49_011505 [Dermacentor silvarum]|uniref:Uncharacterized protein n=1 Tax=Dermacentor silvarum TaxID=543639 RepID=A0ACB8CX48_DERSI|nr:hypothetical protein HPB49_011505 [Dermacentor silvarum]